MDQVAEGLRTDDEYIRMEQQTDYEYRNQESADIGSHFPPEALKYYIDHPDSFIEDVFFYRDESGQLLPVRLENWQRGVCEAIADPDRGFVSIAAGSGVGKSFMLSKLVYWFLLTRKGKVPCTAPTEHQLFDILWSELRKDYDNSPILQKIFTWTQTKLFVKGHVATWFAVARTATVRKDGKVLEGLQGFHDPHLMYLIDEASGVPDAAMAAVDGALTAPNAKILMTSNPTRLSGRFYNSHNRSSRAHGGPWEIFSIDCRDSIWVGTKYVDMMTREHGEESPIFKAKVAGQFPDQEENTLITKRDFDVFLSGKLPDRVFTEHDIGDIIPQKAPVYQSSVYATEEHELIAMRFFGKIGFKGLIGRVPGVGMNAGQFRPPTDGRNQQIRRH